MTIKCVASIYTAYYKTVEVTVGLRKRSKHRRRQHEARVVTTEASTGGPGGDHHNGNLTSAYVEMIDITPQLIPSQSQYCTPALQSNHYQLFRRC